MPNRLSLPFQVLRIGLAASAILMAMPSTGQAADLFPGPVQARILRIIDGDTFAAEALIWPGQVLTVNVRLRGIDAPELHSRCAAEREAAKRAARTLAEIVGSGGEVSISNIGSDKYYGRVVADVANGEGEPLAERMLDEGVVRTYDSGARADWCRQGMLTGLLE